MSIIEDFEYLSKELKRLEKEAEEKKNKDLAKEAVQQASQQAEPKSQEYKPLGNWKGSMGGICRNNMQLEQVYVIGGGIYIEYSR